MRTFVGFGLLLAFALVFVSCGFGTISFLPAMHGGGTECVCVFISEFTNSQKGLGVGLAIILLATFLFLLSIWTAVLVGWPLSESRTIHRLLVRRTMFLRLCDHVLQQFSQGILHPQIY